jgi:hypothetical protein
MGNRTVLFCLSVLLAAAFALPAPVQADAAVAAAVPVATERYAVVVDNETALGYLAYPTSGAPSAMLVFGHGCCGKPNQTSFVRGYAASYNVVAVAMDYRGFGGFDVLKGSQDLVAATVDLQARFPSVTRTVLWGASMGGETTGMAVAARPDLFDYWVDTFGVTNLFEEFVVLGHYPGVSPNPNDPGNPTGSYIVRETGGTPLTVPEEYAKRSPALMADRMVGIRRAYISHGVGDLIVPYSMSREMYANLVAAGVPVTLFTVLTGPGGQQPAWGVPVPAPCSTVVPDPDGSGPAPGACAPLSCAPGPTGCVGLPPYGPYGLAAHDGRGGAPNVGVVDKLLRGLEPDAGIPAAEWLVDYTTAKSQRVPP